MINTLRVYQELKELMDNAAAMKIAEFMGKIYEDLLNTVTKADFNELKESLNRLAEAQKRTEEKVEALAEAQKRTEEKVEALAEAQEEISKTLKNLAIEVASLSGTVGFSLEDIGRVVIPGYLERHCGIKIEEPERKFIPCGKDYVEINLYAEGIKDSRKVIILGEAKNRIYKKEVMDFIKSLKKIENKFGDKEIFKLMFAYLVHPSGQELAKKNNIILVCSYQR